MFAVVKIGGLQYKVIPGQKLAVAKVTGNAGDTIKYPALLVAEGENVKLGKDAAEVMITAKIVEHGQGEKIHIRRFRNKSRHRRHIGFRAQLTTISIEAIGDSQKVEKAVAEAQAAEKPKTPRKRVTKPKTAKA